MPVQLRCKRVMCAFVFVVAPIMHDSVRLVYKAWTQTTRAQVDPHRLADGPKRCPNRRACTCHVVPAVQGLSGICTASCGLHRRTFASSCRLQTCTGTVAGFTLQSVRLLRLARPPPRWPHSRFARHQRYYTKVPDLPSLLKQRRPR